MPIDQELHDKLIRLRLLHSSHEARLAMLLREIFTTCSGCKPKVEGSSDYDDPTPCPRHALFLQAWRDTMKAG